MSAPSSALRKAIKAALQAGDELGYNRNYSRGLIKFGQEGMTPEAKAIRAEAAGFDLNDRLFHSTLDDTEAFATTGKFMGHKGVSGVSMTDRPEMANRYLDRYGERRYDGKAFQKNVMPLVKRSDVTAEFDKALPMPRGTPMGAPLPADYKWPRHLDGVDTLEFPDRITRKGGVAHWKPGDEDLLEALSDDGVMSAREVIARHPSNIRSVHATFDPARKHRRDLMAALALSLGGAGAGFATQDEQA